MLVKHIKRIVNALYVVLCSTHFHVIAKAPTLSTPCFAISYVYYGDVPAGLTERYRPDCYVVWVRVTSEMTDCCTAGRAEAACSADEFECTNGNCVADSLVNNTVNDCVDNSDEGNASLRDHVFKDRTKVVNENGLWTCRFFIHYVEYIYHLF